MSNLTEHAHRELRLIHEDQEIIDATLLIVETFAKCGHSGSSAAMHIAMIESLLRFQNLSPLTDDPDEWQFIDQSIWGEYPGIWQNRRNPEAFSEDGGKHFYLLSQPFSKKTPYVSMHKTN